MAIMDMGYGYQDRAEMKKIADKESIIDAEFTEIPKERLQITQEPKPCSTTNTKP